MTGRTMRARRFDTTTLTFEGIRILEERDGSPVRILVQL